nr:alcohol dehydrogenase catalytic domain-containing protein [Candidatus Njordarchaeota archaeon]
MATMKASFFQGPDKRPKFTIEETEIPQLKEDEVLVKVKAAALCGTDLHVYEGRMKASKLPIIMGHEWAGNIVSVGANVKALREGDRVFSAPHYSCGSCYYCRSGRENLCEQRGVFGAIGPRDGCFAEYAVAPFSSLYLLPSEITYEVGSLIGDTLSTAAHALQRARITPGDTVAIWGLGPVGQCLLQMARIAGAGRVIAIDVVSDRVSLARKLGADVALNSKEKDPVKFIKDQSNGRGVDLTIEAAGAPVTYMQAFEATAKGGKLLLVAVHDKPVETALRAIMWREVSIIGSFAHVASEADKFVELVLNDRVKLDPLISHRFPLEKINEAFELFAGRKTNKVVLVCRGEENGHLG